MPVDVASHSPVALRYARSLLALAREGGSVAAVEGDMEALAAMLGESDDLRGVLASPIIPAVQKAHALGAIAKKAGFCDLTTRFLAVVLRAGRGDVLGAILRAFATMLSADRGEVVASVQSAVPLTATQTKALAKSLGTTRLEASVDEGLLGGLVITVGSLRLDDSLKSKLARLGDEMRGGRAAA